MALLLLLAILLVGTPASGDDYDDFNAFALSSFGAEKEVEIYNMLGRELGLDPAGDWVHASETSAAIAWETTLPARARVEYGVDSAYGQTTAEDERPFFLHLHYLKDLAPDTTYHYRLVSVDERGNRVASEDRTVTTATPAGTVHVPDDLAGSPPYTLDQDNAVYVVTADITAPSTVFNLAATGATLDLNGHTIVYDDVAGAPDPVPPGDWSWYSTQGPCGVRTLAYVTARIVNGTIRQGEGNGPPAGVEWSYNPVFMRRPRDSEAAGLTLEYRGPQITGIRVDSAYGSNRIHHTVVIDRGAVVINRHTGLDGIGLDIEDPAGSFACDHNLMKRVRHRGLTTQSNTDIGANEIYIDSWATNSYGVLYYSSNAAAPDHDIVIHDNRIFGTGFHPIGIGAGYYANDIAITSNYIEMLGAVPSTYRWPGGTPGDPVGQEHPANGIRFHQGPERNVDVGFNRVVVKARGVVDEIARMRGLWVTPNDVIENVVYHDNVIKQIAENEYADGHAVACLGDPGDTANMATVIAYERNTIASNTCNVRFGDSYGSGGKHHFTGNTLIRLGADPRYATIKFGWEGWNYESYGHTFLDSDFSGGASYDSLAFESAGPAYDDFTVLWTLTLETYPGSSVSIEDAAASTVYAATVGPSGEERVPLVSYLRTKAGKAFSTPHTVTVVMPCGETAVEAVTMDRRRTLTVYRCGADVLRNDEITTLAPLSHALQDVFTTLRAGPPYIADALPGVVDQDATVLVDAARPLVFYELTDTAPRLFVLSTAAARVELAW